MRFNYIILFSLLFFIISEPCYCNTNDPKIRKIKQIHCQIDYSNKIIGHKEQKIFIKITNLGPYKIGEYQDPENRYKTITDNEIYLSLKADFNSIVFIVLFDSKNHDVRYIIDKMGSVIKIPQSIPLTIENGINITSYFQHFFPAISIDNYSMKEKSYRIFQKVDSSKNGKIYTVELEWSHKRAIPKLVTAKYYFRQNELWWYKKELYYDGELADWYEEIDEKKW